MMWAVIGGSGFEKFDGFEVLATLPRETPFGKASSGLKKVKVNGHEALFLSRHGEHHELLPSEINYRANIYALKKEGAQAIISFSAVGSLQAELAPGHLLIPNQYIDRTKGLRASTFCGDGVVGHMSLAYPTCETLAKQVFELYAQVKQPSHLGGTYVCIEGPNFSTLAESLSYRSLPAQVIGMTNFPEYSLAREAGLSYVPCCFVTDYDCWDTSRPHVTIAEVLKVMKENNAKAFALLKLVLDKISQDSVKTSREKVEGLKSGLMRPKDYLRPEQLEWLSVLTK